jgi:hypothetical protein
LAIGMASNIRHVLREVAGWLWQRIESFPIPIEDALWVETYGNLEAKEHVSGGWEDPRHVSNPY